MLPLFYAIGSGTIGGGSSLEGSSGGEGASSSGNQGRGGFEAQAQTPLQLVAYEPKPVKSMASLLPKPVPLPQLPLESLMLTPQALGSGSWGMHSSGTRAGGFGAMPMPMPIANSKRKSRSRSKSSESSKDAVALAAAVAASVGHGPLLHIRALKDHVIAVYMDLCVVCYRWSPTPVITCTSLVHHSSSLILTRTRTYLPYKQACRINS